MVCPSLCPSLTTCHIVCCNDLELTTSPTLTASGPIPPFNIAKLSAKNISIMRSTLMQYIVTREELEFYANGVLDLIKAGKLNIKIHKVYPLSEAVTAHKDLEGRRTTGKLLLKL